MTTRITAPGWHTKLGEIVALVLGMIVFHLRLIMLPQHGLSELGRWDSNSLVVLSLIVYATAVLTGIPKTEVKWSEREPMFDSNVSGVHVQTTLGLPTRITITMFFTIIIMSGLGYKFW